VKLITKVLLAVEVFACFAPMAILLLVGIAIAPMQLQFLFSSYSEARPGALLFLVAVGAGIAGMAALANVMLWLFSPPTKFLSRRWTLAGMVLGMLPVAFYAFGPVDSMSWRLAGLLPLACACHIAYLARDFLFSGTVANESLDA